MVLSLVVCLCLLGLWLGQAACLIDSKRMDLLFCSHGCVIMIGCQQHTRPSGGAVDLPLIVLYVCVPLW